MFHRIIYDHWTAVVPIVGFLLTFAVFLAAVIRALLMKREQCDEMASLPLENRSSSCKCDKSCGCCERRSSHPRVLNPES